MRAKTILLLTSTLLVQVWPGGPAGGRRAFAQESPERRAEAEQKARASYARGELAFKNERYQEALVAFEDGYAASPRPGFLLNIGHTWRKLGDLRQARAQYKKYLLIEPSSPLHDDLVALIAELDATIAEEDRLAARSSVPVEAVTAGAAKTIPAAVLLRAPIPSAHSTTTSTDLVVRRDGSRAAASEDSAAPLYRRTWFWVAVGVVAAGAGAAIYAGQHASTAPDYQRSGNLGSLGAP